MLLVVMPGAPSSVRSLLVAMPFAPSSFLFLANVFCVFVIFAKSDLLLAYERFVLFLVQTCDPFWCKGCMFVLKAKD